MTTCCNLRAGLLPHPCWHRTWPCEPQLHTRSPSSQERSSALSFFCRATLLHQLASFQLKAQSFESKLFMWLKAGIKLFGRPAQRPATAVSTFCLLWAFLRIFLPQPGSEKKLHSFPTPLRSRQSWSLLSLSGKPWHHTINHCTVYCSDSSKRRQRTRSACFQRQQVSGIAFLTSSRYL